MIKVLKNHNLSISVTGIILSAIAAQIMPSYSWAIVTQFTGIITFISLYYIMRNQ